MKPIYECLDYLLDHLYQNRFKQEGQRIPFDVDHKVLPELQLNNHEEFKGLIDILVEDNYAFFIDGYKDDLENYKNRTMISVKGIFHYETKGYRGKENRDKALADRLRKVENMTLTLTAIIAAGTFVAALYYLTKLYWEHYWFRSGFWWTLVVTVVFLCAVTTYLIWRMLPPRKQRKQ